MILACDLGTGGVKVCVFYEDGKLHSKTFKEYSTQYPSAGFHVQNPDDWCQAVIEGTSELIVKDNSLKNSIHSIAMSGHSLAVVPIDTDGKLIFHDVPIWSDTRTSSQCEQFFSKINKEEWYLKTGNGFTPECYSLFKIMWYRENYPLQYKRIHKILGSKDYLNYLMTGNIATDYSYASGSGAYNLVQREYINDYFKAARVDQKLLPEPGASHEFVGKLTAAFAEKMGLHQNVNVYCGGVDNSCMALGAKNTIEGKAYLSLGSSAWIAVSTKKPLIDIGIKPFIFDHVIPRMYTSATSIFSAGSSLKWFKENMAGAMAVRAETEGRDVYDLITEAAAESPCGSNGIFFNPTFAGAPEASEYLNITGALLNVRLGSNFNDLCRSILEGVTYELYSMYCRLNDLCNLSDEIVIVGGGSKSAFWRQMFADVFDCSFSRISTDQDAAALGAAAIAAVGSGVWKDYSEIENVIIELETVVPDAEASAVYKSHYKKYSATWKMLSEIGQILND